jgi:heme-degrading monooxygenase HmoA
MPHIQTSPQPVVQITFIEADPENQDQAMSVMKQRADFMSRQPGFISISLHRSLDERRIVNYIQWENRDLLQRAHQAPEFRKAWGHFDRLTADIDPHLYEVAHIRETEPGKTAATPD